MISALKNSLVGLVKSQPVVDENTEAWLQDAFLWAYHEFDGELLLPTMRFILPTAEYFPKQVNSIEQMAGYVFEQVVEYAQMQAWPLQLVGPQQMRQQAFPAIEFASNKRGETAHLISHSSNVLVSFNPNQINQPQDLIASFAQSLSYINVLQSRSLPPGGQELLPQAVDLLACFMGFGVMMANTAYQFKGGCGSCYNPYANRSSSLAEGELSYLIALLLRVKKQPLKTVLPHLKPHLRSLLKKADKQLAQSIVRSANPMLIALTEAK